MHHYRAGRGSPLVLIHGLGSRWQVWRPVLDALTAHHDVIALDLPGFGRTPPDRAPVVPAPGSVPRLADQVTHFLTALGVERPAVGGSSLGGGVALELGRRGVARAVTVFSPAGFAGPGGTRWARGVVSAARAAGAALGPALPPLLRTRAGRVALCGLFYGHPARLSAEDGAADARALIVAPGFAAARAGLGEWRFRPDGMPAVPVTIAWGTRDLVLPYRQAAHARRLLPAARHVRLEGCGHLPFADDPGTCARLLRETS